MWKLIDECKNTKVFTDQSKTEDERAEITVKYICLDHKLKISCCID